MIKIDLKKIPSKPGVYLFKDKNGKPLYIGKAKDLKKRFSQYLKSDSLKIKELLKNASDLEFLITNSEAEAIFKESDLIKKFNPPFNQLLRDDTNYFYVIFTKEEFPRVLVIHQPNKFNYFKIFGPFTEGTALRTLLRIVRKTTPFCTCKEKHLRECLNYNLNLCYGFCCLKNYKIKKEDKEKYYRSLEIIEKILGGDFFNLKKELIGEIKENLEKDNLKEAQRLKEIYLAIKKIENEIQILKEDSFLIENQRKKVLLELKEKLKLSNLPNIIEVYDISHLAGKEKVGIIVSFYEGRFEPQKLRKFKIKTVLKPDDPRMIYEVLKRRLKHNEWGLPDLILVDGGKIQFKFTQKAIEEANVSERIKIISFAKPKEEIYYSLKEPPMPLEKFSKITADFIRLLDTKAHQYVLKYHKQLREFQK
ncbi:MAG: hypothetical protein C4348_01310 [Patescibacteria group bacterium]